MKFGGDEDRRYMNMEGTMRKWRCLPARVVIRQLRDFMESQEWKERVTEKVTGSSEPRWWIQRVRSSNEGRPRSQEELNNVYWRRRLSWLVEAAMGSISLMDVM